MQKRWLDRFRGTFSTLFKRGALFILSIFAASTLTLSPIISPTAQAQDFGGLASAAGSLFQGTSSCTIETVGWIICPTLRSIAKLADFGFAYINKSFLKIEYSLAANDSGTYKAWEMMRTIANGLFVIAFMAIIYAQLTGKGGGYNIKRLAPKLVLAALLVNISYFICVALIDVVNILGDSLLYVLADQTNGIAGKAGRLIMPVGVTPVAFLDGTLTMITSSVLSKGGFAWVLLAPVAAVTTTVATICAVGVVVLIMRKVVVAMLILLSPILFVAYLLPNLERFFFQGMRLFLQLLFLYPVVALLLGAGQIVSATIVTVGTNDSTNYGVVGDYYFSRVLGSGSAITDLTAAGAAVLPLLAVWFVFKSMSTLMSTAGARLQASVAGRRGGDEDKNARVTGNATAGARANKFAGGIPPQTRRQAFSRTKRKTSLGGSFEGTGSLTGGGGGRGAGATNNQSTALAAQNALDASLKGDTEDTAKRLEDLNSARIASAEGGEVTAENSSANNADIGEAVANAMGKDDKQITAKDLFNDLNKSHDSKDKDRKFSSGPAPAGSGGGNSGGNGTAQPQAPVASYKAPQMAASGNVVSGTSAQKSGGGAPTVIVQQVQIDPSSLVKPIDHTPANLPEPMRGSMGEAAKERANKYLFGAEKEVSEARDRQDILGHKKFDDDKKDGI